MSYASFIAFVVSQVQERVDTSQDGEAAAQAALFWERLLAMLASTEGNVTEAIERLRAAVEPAWLAFSSGLAFFVAQNAAGCSAERRRSQDPNGGGCSPSRPRPSSPRSSGSPAAGFPTPPSGLSCLKELLDLLG